MIMTVDDSRLIKAKVLNRTKFLLEMESDQEISVLVVEQDGLSDYENPGEESFNHIYEFNEKLISTEIIIPKGKFGIILENNSDNEAIVWLRITELTVF